MISVALSVILNTLALILAARILDIALRIIPALLVAGHSWRQAGTPYRGSRV